jgi:hypothetical protein
MALLPHDQNTNKVNKLTPDSSCLAAPGYTGYAYRSDGIDYKIMAECLIEGTAPPSSDPFYDPTRAANAWAVFSSSTAGAWY